MRISAAIAPSHLSSDRVTSVQCHGSHSERLEGKNAMRWSDTHIPLSLSTADLKDQCSPAIAGRDDEPALATHTRLGALEIDTKSDR
jgi:hypothetical protein